MLQFLICIVLMILLLCFPRVAHEGAEYGLSIFLDTLLPYFLPIIILANWLLALQPIGNSSKVALYTKSYLLCAIGGYPTGAVLLSKLVQSNHISKKEASYLLPILHFPNPLFILGFYAVDLLQNIQIGIYYLLCIHFLAICSLIIIYKVFKHETLNRHPVNYEGSLPDAFRESVQPLLIVGITIIFFTTVSAVILHIMHSNNFMNTHLEVFIISALEITNGLLIGHELYNAETFIFASTFLLTTQSLSIHMQVAAISKVASIPLKPYIIYRTILSIVVPLLFLYIIFP